MPDPTHPAHHGSDRAEPLPGDPQPAPAESPPAAPDRLPEPPPPDLPPGEPDDDWVAV